MPEIFEVIRADAQFQDFLPVIEEVLESRASPDYFRYLRHKLANVPPAW